MRFLFILTLILPILSNGQNSLLYEVTNPSNNAKSYLFGTMHEQDERAFSFNDSVFWAIDHSTTAAFELDMSMDALKSFDRSQLTSWIDTQFVKDLVDFMGRELLPAIADEVPKEDFVRFFTESMMGAYTELVTAKLEKDNRTTNVDMFLQDYARSHDKEVIGIESLEEQFKALFTDIQQVDLNNPMITRRIIKKIKSNELNLDMLAMFTGNDEMLSIYEQQDMDGLCQYIADARDDGGEFSERFYRRLIEERNVIMFDRMKERIEEGEVFIAVGSGHICGTSGLIEQCRKAGLTVRPMNALIDYERDIVWSAIENDHYRVDVPLNTELTYDDDNMARISTPGANYGIPSNEHMLYTSKGRAKFSITRKDTGATATQQMDWQSLLKAMQEMQADTSSRSAEVLETDVLYEEELIVDDGETDVSIPEPEPVEELQIEVVEEEATFDSEVEAAFEEVEHYEVEDVPVVETKEQVESRRQPSGRTAMLRQLERAADHLTNEQEVYYEEAWEEIEDYFNSEMKSIMGKMFASMAEKHEESRSIILSGMPTDLVYTSSITGSTLQAEVEYNGSIFTIKVEGDPIILKSGELDRFFESLVLK